MSSCHSKQEDKHPSLPNDAIIINQKRFQKVSDCVSHLCQEELHLYYANHIIIPYPFCIHFVVFRRIPINHFIQCVIYLGFRLMNFAAHFAHEEAVLSKRNQDIIGLITFGEQPQTTGFNFFLINHDLMLQGLSNENCSGFALHSFQLLFFLCTLTSQPGSFFQSSIKNNFILHF